MPNGSFQGPRETRALAIAFFDGFSRPYASTAPLLDMPKVSQISKGLNVSITGFASEFGSTRETIAKRIAAAGLKPADRRAGHPVYRLRDLHKAVYQSAAEGGVDPDRLDPFQRKAHYQAEHEKLALETERGELIPRIECEADQARMTKIVAQFFDTLPDRIERDCGVSPLVLAKVEQSLDAVREELYRAVAEPEEDADRAVR